jgi:hypothetical protein
MIMLEKPVEELRAELDGCLLTDRRATIVAELDAGLAALPRHRESRRSPRRAGSASVMRDDIRRRAARCEQLR